MMSHTQFFLKFCFKVAEIYEKEPVVSEMAPFEL
jgi:hypothetical protein